MIFVDEMVYGILPLDTPLHLLDRSKGFMPLCWQDEIREASYAGVMSEAEKVTCKECLEWMHA